MCTNRKIHAALLKTKTQTIAKMKYLVYENPKKKKKKQKYKLTNYTNSATIITIINQEQIKIITIKGFTIYIYS
jgi:hypothetical protein